MGGDPGTSVTSGPPTLCSSARLGSLLLSVATSPAFANFSVAVPRCETWSQPSSSFKRRLIPTAPSCLFLPPKPPCGKRTPLPWCRPFACCWFAVKLLQSCTPSISRSPAYIHTLSLNTPLLHSSTPVRIHHPLHPAARTGLQHPRHRAKVTKEHFCEFGSSPESNLLSLIPAAAPPEPPFQRDLPAIDEAEETGLLTLLNHTTALHKQARP